MKMNFTPSHSLQIIFPFLLFALTSDALAGTITSTATGGNWSADTTWAGGMTPAPGDDVIILAGATVHISNAIPITINSLTNNGTLDVISGSTASNFSFTVTGAFNNNGTFNYAPPSITNKNVTCDMGSLVNTGTFTTSARGAGSGSGSNSINITGDWTNSGTYIHNYSVVTFSGIPSTITGATSFYDITISNSGPVIIDNSTTITINDTWTNNYTGLAMTTGTVKFTGTSNISAAGRNTTFNNIEIDNSPATFTANKNFDIEGNWVNDGGTFVPNTYTVTFSGTTTQHISGNTTFYDLTLSNTVDFTTSVITINNTLSNSSGTMTPGTSTIIFTGSAGSIIGSSAKNFYNLQINSDANISHTSGRGNIHIDNSFLNNGTFTEATARTFFFDKSGATETMSGTGATTFGNLTVGGTGLSLPTTLNISSGFDMKGQAITFDCSNSSLTATTGTATFLAPCDIKNGTSVSGTYATFYNLTANAGVVQVDVPYVTVTNIFNLAGTNTYTIGSNKLTLNGPITGTGFITGSSTSNLTIDGIAGIAYFDQTSDRITNMLHDFTVNTGGVVTLGNKLYINAGTSPGTVTANGSINTGSTTTDNSAANLVICSNQDGTASVGNSSGTITGSVTVERYIATGTDGSPEHAKSWQLLAVPSTGSQTIHEAWQENGTTSAGYGTTITGTGTGFDITASPSMKTYDPSSESYTGVSGTGIPIYNQNGYFLFVRGDRTVTDPNAAATTTILRTTGTLIFGPTVPVTVADGQFESVGNPYASAIDMRNFLLSGGTSQNYIVWDPRLGGAYGYGGFQTLTEIGSNFYAVPGHGSYGYFNSSADNVTDNYIQSGQAFFIQASGSNGSLSFDESAKATGSALVTTPTGPAAFPQYLSTGLFAVNPDHTCYLIDGVLNIFGDNYNNNVDNSDARKLVNSSENLGIERDGRLLAVERRRTLHTQDTIFLQISNLKAPADYRLVFTANKIDISGLQPYLEDSYLRTKTPLHISDTTLIDFSTDGNPASTDVNRFRIVLDAAGGPLPLTFTNVKAYTKNNAIAVDWQVDNQSGIASYDVEKSASGIDFFKSASISSDSALSGNYEWIDEGPATGYNYYRIRSIATNGSAIYSNVVKAYISSGTSRIVIYPNPISGNMVHLRLENEPAGNYYINLLNTAGQVIAHDMITVSETGMVYHDLALPGNLAPGVYSLRVQNAAGNAAKLNFVK